MIAQSAFAFDPTKLPLAGGTMTGGIQNTGQFDLTSQVADGATAVGFLHKTSILDKDTFTLGALHSQWVDAGGDQIAAMEPDGALMLGFKAAGKFGQLGLRDASGALDGILTGGRAANNLFEFHRATVGTGLFLTLSSPSSTMVRFRSQHTDEILQPAFLFDTANDQTFASLGQNIFEFRKLVTTLLALGSDGVLKWPSGGASFVSNEPDSATAVGFLHTAALLDKDTHTAGAFHTVWEDAGGDVIMKLNPAGALHLRGTALVPSPASGEMIITTQGSNDGNLFTPTGVVNIRSAAFNMGLGVRSGFGGRLMLFANTAGSGAGISGKDANDANAIAVLFRSDNILTVEGGRLASFANGSTEKLAIGKDGDIFLGVLTDATRPAPGSKGRFFFNDDDGQLNVDDGTNWTLPDGTTT